MNIILLNGPPGSGKDWAGLALLPYQAQHLYKFATVLKDAMHTLLGMSLAPTDMFEDDKNTPNPVFFGLSPRQAYIALSENFAKPTFGPSFFGQILLRKLISCRYDCVAITDCGFEAEIAPIVERFGQKSILLLRCHRPGHSFAGDSRSYVELPGVATLDLHNTGTLAAWQGTVQSAVARLVQYAGAS